MTILQKTAPRSAQRTLRALVGEHMLLSFFLLAYGWTWGLIGLAFAGMQAGILSEDGPIIALLASLAPFGPAVAAIIAASIKDGTAGLRSLLSSLNPRQSNLGWYTLALLAPPLAFVLVESIVYGTMPLVTLAEKWPTILIGYTLNVLVVLFQTGIAEELGWRGIALPLLSTRHGAIASTLILGVAAGFWHLPNAILQPGGLASFGLTFLYTILVAFLLNWAYHRNRGSVLIVALFHAALNTSTGLIMQLLPAVDRAQLVQHIYLVAIIVVAVAAALLLVVTKGQFAAHKAADREAV